MGRDIWAGVDIGGTKTSVVVSRRPPEILSRIEFATLPTKGPIQALDQILAALHRMLAELKTGPESLCGIGVSCGGPLDPHAGVIQAPPNLSTWIDIPIVEILNREFAAPVLLENDANAGALAEHRYGAGQGTRNMIFLTMGTGLGAGLIIEKKLYSGSSDMAGEIGHVRLTRTGPVGYHKAGSVEGWASGGGMAQIAETMLNSARRRGRSSLLHSLPKGRKATAKDVGLAAAKGDAVARSIVAACGKKLGIALAILVDILNPDRIVIGGLAMRLGDALLEPALKSLRQEALAPALAACTVVPATLGESIGDVAALCIAMDAGNPLKARSARGKG
ncbi:MAG TPA: ROK family protein [Terracidiphilus sp.]|nr:ROK family protein [Terracidiphilus sp.]